MSRRIAWGILTAAVAAVALAACGGSGGDPQQARSLLRQSFRGRPINSGSVTVSLAVSPSGSQTVNGPIEVNFGGPFEARGNGQAPKSDFTIRLSALGRSGSLGVISTGTKGYVKLQGTSYQLPQATFRQFESGLTPLTNSTNSSLFGKYPRVNFMSWVRNPVVVGDETVAGTNTKHIHGGLEVHKMLSDLNLVIHKAPSAGVSGLGSGISAATVDRIASQVRNPSLDVWTGANDHMMRKLAVNFGVPVSGSVSTLFGGLRAAHVSLVIQYADINQPQTITAPSSVKPFSQFVTKLRAFLAGVQGSLSGAAPSAGSGTSGGTASTQKLQRYSQCIQSASGDVTKMQRCAAILNGQ